MKDKLCIIACLLAAGVQNVAAQDYFSSASNFSRLYIGLVEPQYNMALWRDSPFYKNDPKMRKGRVSYCGVVYEDVMLRFDQYKQQLAVSSPVVNALCLPEQQNINWFEMDGHRYVHAPEDSSKYAIELCDGSANGMRLYHTVWKNKANEVSNGKIFLSTLSTEERYTLVTPDGNMYEVKNSSDLAKLFPEQKRSIKSFAKQNKLKFNKYFREINLPKLVATLPGDPLPKEAIPSVVRGEVVLPPAVALRSIEKPQDVIKGIPVIDSSLVAETAQYNKEKVFYMPGVKKAKVSLADDHELGEILVVAGRQSAVKNTMMGSEKFKPELLKNIPSAFGEADIMKIVLTLPGVTTVGEASSGYNVRGGATDQNLILYNGGTVYNPSHLFGLFTSFNSDAVEDVELFKSSIPAEYGGRISSVLKVNSKEANMKKFTGNASIGILTSKANLEIPIVEDHVSLLVNGRTTYSDWMLDRLPKKSGYKNGKANFYDFGGVLTWKLSNMHRLKVFGYWSNDWFSFSDTNNYGYKNRNLSAEWRSIFNEKLSVTLSGGMDHYDYFNEESATPYSAARLSFGIDQLWAKLHFRHPITDKFTLNYGVMTQHYDIQAGEYKPVGELSTVISDKLDNEYAQESSAYVDFEHRFTEKFSVAGGVRYTLFNALGPREVRYYDESSLPSESNLLSKKNEEGNIKSYQAPEFRFSTRYAIKENLSVKAGFNTMHQYIHKVSNTAIMSPTDIWKLSDNNIKPQNGWQVAAGVYKETKDKQYEFSAEVYYKHINDYLNYRNSAVLLMNHHLETDVISTKGKAYGLELQVKKPFGKLNGWVSYTLSRSLLRQDDKRVEMPLNDGKWYPSEYDRPHEIKAVLNYKFTERYSLSSNFNYATGRPTTVPAGEYYDWLSGSDKPYFTERNGYRIPDYMRCDFAFNIEPTHKLTSFLHTSFSIGVYNAFARRNAYNVYYVSEKSKIQGYKISVFGSAIPYVSLNMKFN